MDRGGLARQRVWRLGQGMETGFLLKNPWQRRN
jgi:hypothetical protein